MKNLRPVAKTQSDESVANHQLNNVIETSFTLLTV